MSLPFLSFIYTAFIEAGFINHLALQILCLLSVVLLFLGLPKPKSAKITFIPCMICASFATIILYALAMEIFVAYYSGGKYEWEAFKLRITGPYWYAYVIKLLTSSAPLLLFFPKLHKSLVSVLILALLGLLAVWFERLVILFTLSV